ncbi:MAG: hypothetical protein R2867_13365 [Caldilineaceae bacterium]
MGISSGTILFKGLTITLTVAVSAYACALVLGLTFGLMRSSSNPILLREYSSFMS